MTSDQMVAVIFVLATLVGTLLILLTLAMRWWKEAIDLSADTLRLLRSHREEGCDIIGKLAGYADDYLRLLDAVARYGLVVARSSGDWSLCDASEAALIEEERVTALINDNIDLEYDNAELRRTLERLVTATESITGVGTGCDAVASELQYAKELLDAIADDYAEAEADEHSDDSAEQGASA